MLVAFCADGWQSRWTESTFKGSEQGKWGWSTGKFFNDPQKDKGTIWHIFYCFLYWYFIIFTRYLIEKLVCKFNPSTAEFYLALSAACARPTNRPTAVPGLICTAGGHVQVSIRRRTPGSTARRLSSTSRSAMRARRLSSSSASNTSRRWTAAAATLRCSPAISIRRICTVIRHTWSCLAQTSAATAPRRCMSSSTTRARTS